VGGRLIVCHAWPCCDPIPYTVRRYHADGTTAWVRNYGWPANKDAVPIDVAVASDGRVFVAGPRVVSGDLAWDLRCYSADGETLWVRTLPLETPLLGIREIDVDAADNVYVLAANHFLNESGTHHARRVFCVSDAGELLLNDFAEVILGGVIPEGLLSYARLAVAADGTWIVTPNFTVADLFALSLHDVAFVAPGLAVSAGDGPPQFLYGTINLFETATLTVLDQVGDPGRAAGVAADEQGRIVVKRHATDFAVPNQIVQFAVSATAIGDATWSHPCRPRDTHGGIDMNRATSRTAVLLDGDFDEHTPPSDAHLRWPSLACLDAAGNVLWSHFHHDRIEVSIGEDGSVATVGAPLVLGRQEWNWINSLTGV
jgi:hypothetical protein